MFGALIPVFGIGMKIVAHFTASWCIPSVAMNSVFKELDSVFHDITFHTVDVDDLKVTSSKYDVEQDTIFVDTYSV